jgi:phosphatidylglycerol:prolipoprotein diacylglycerol transferase
MASYFYAKKRFERVAIPTEQFWIFATGIIAFGLVGARLAHLATNWSLYSHRPGQWLAVWNGGLASFGGIALAVPAGVLLQRRIWPHLSLATFLDRLVPALLLGWAIGRALGPQFMYAGGGHPTHQWFGLYYQGQIGKRVPVPLIQALEDVSLWLGAITLERRHPRPGLVSGTVIFLWGLIRSLDEYFLLGQHSHSGSLGVQICGVALSAMGATLVVRSLKN